jgi:mono/diheme cytochrome c family protein
MREIIARIVSVLTVCVVGALSLLFASAHNPRDRGPAVNIAAPPVPPVTVTSAATGDISPQPIAPAPVPGAPAAALERGRAVYEQHNCATCHSVAGEGNPRNPLDRVGEWWDAKELEEWITGVGTATEFLSAAVARRKQRYQSLPREDLDALIAYLANLKSAK